MPRILESFKNNHTISLGSYGNKLPERNECLYKIINLRLQCKQSHWEIGDLKHQSLCMSKMT